MKQSIYALLRSSWSNSLVNGLIVLLFLLVSFISLSTQAAIGDDTITAVGTTAINTSVNNINGTTTSTLINAPSVTTATINTPVTNNLASSNNPLGIPALTMSTNANGGQDYSVNLQILAIMTGLSFLPAIVIMMTSFIRITVVMSILRQATGLQQAPSNQIIVGIALFMTFFIMSPVFDRVNEVAVQPYLNEQIPAKQAFENAQGPFKLFMLKQTRLNDLESFSEIARISVSDPSQVPMRVLIPAFVTSELKTAFQIGFMLFLPFLVIDLVVASILMSMGMMMLSPMIVSLPFKLMLFVLVDGWSLVLRSLAGSFDI